MGKREQPDSPRDSPDEVDSRTQQCYGDEAVRPQRLDEDSNGWRTGILLTRCRPLAALPWRRHIPCSHSFRVISGCITVVPEWQTSGLSSLM